MKLLFLSVIVLAGQFLSAQVPDPLNFYSGRTFGQCLVVKCRVFIGSLLGDTPPIEGEVVQIKATEELFGPGGGEIVNLTFADPKKLRKAYDPRTQAWKIGGGISYSGNKSVIVALALEPTFGLDEGEPLIVSSNEDVANIGRHLAIEAKRMERFPEGIAGAGASLSSKIDGPMAGYLYVYLQRRQGFIDPEAETSLLSQMIDSPSVPTIAWQDIGVSMMLNYSHLSTGGRGSLVSRFVDLALKPDVQAAAVGFRGLGHISTHLPEEVSAMVDPAMRSKLAVAYRVGLLNRKVSGDKALDTLLGVKSELVEPAPANVRRK